MKVINPSPELEARQFDPTKPVQTRDGRKARIICSDRLNARPIVACILEHGGTETLLTFKENGEHFNTYDNLSLVNIPVKEERYHFCSKEGITYGTYWNTLEQAKEAFSRGVTIVAYGILKKTYVDDKLSALELVHIF